MAQEQDFEQYPHSLNMSPLGGLMFIEICGHMALHLHLIIALAAKKFRSQSCFIFQCPI